MTNKMKLPSILALIVILFLSLSAVSASENIDLVTNATDSAIDDTIAISDSNNDLTSGFDDSNHEITDNDLITDTNDLDDEIASSKESEKIGSSYEEPDTLSAEPIVIDSSNYLQYFDSDGKIKSGALKDGDTIKIKSISDRIFTIDKRLNIISDDGATLSNCLIRLVKGSSGSVLENLKIINTKEKINNYYLSGISIIDSSENTIRNSVINVSVHKCFAIMMSNASYNKIISNTLISGLSSTIPMTASSYNEIRDN
ncbi:MAG: right-handed parallel beta-helix repeat-containing protein, partial [Methanobrevibacter sp.]|nr:right-handed parallel beta-helix repeat-containing protein [Methanobrevibacter sp.]